MIIAEMLYIKFQEEDEGKLSVMHSNLINTNTLAKIAQEIGIDEAIIMDDGEEQMGGRQNLRNLENTLEALLGAIYLDGGLEEVQRFVTKIWTPLLQNSSALTKRDPKSLLQEWAQKNQKPIPRYSVLNVEGEAHSPIFLIEVSILGMTSQTGTGDSKKSAQRQAAQRMLETIEELGK